MSGITELNLIELAGSPGGPPGMTAGIIDGAIAGQCRW